MTAENLTVKAANINGILTAKQIESGTIVAGSVAAENITGTTITGKTISGGSITIGSNFSVDPNGKITSKSGEIAGWDITSSRLYKENTSSGLYVSLSSPTEVGSFGNANANVLICRTGTSDANYQYPLVLSSDGTLTANKANITGGTIGGLKLYTTTAGNSYLETTGTYTAGVGNNDKWALWAGYNYSNNQASFWVTQNGEVHMRNWIYGAENNVWATWSRHDGGNRFGLEYIYGDYDSIADVMNIKFVFYNHNNVSADTKRFVYTLQLKDYYYSANGY